MCGALYEYQVYKASYLGNAVKVERARQLQQAVISSLPCNSSKKYIMLLLGELCEINIKLIDTKLTLNEDDA
jgi:hypothetical protein